MSNKDKTNKLKNREFIVNDMSKQVFKNIFQEGN